MGKKQALQRLYRTWHAGQLLAIRAQNQENPPSQPASVGVIVVCHGRAAADVLPRCLGAIAAQTRRPESVLVLDSPGPGPSAATVVARMGPQVADALRPDVIGLTGNLGFAAATNLGIVACPTEFIWLLNPDAFPHPECLERLLAAAARHPTAVAFGSRQMIDGRPDIIDGIGDAYGISGLGWRRGHGRRLRPADLVERDIFSPCAAAALYRRAAVMEVGGFDEDFFCYFEDVDLGFRLRLAGHRAISVPDAVVDHVGGVSSGGRRSAFATYHGHRNLVWAFAKNMPLPLAILLLPLHLLQTLASLAVCAARGEAFRFLRAKWDAIRGLPRMLAKRRGIHAGRRVSSWDVWQALAKRPWRE